MDVDEFNSTTRTMACSLLSWLTCWTRELEVYAAATQYEDAPR